MTIENICYSVGESGFYLNKLDNELYFGTIRSGIIDEHDRIFLTLATDFGVITIQVR